VKTIQIAAGESQGSGRLKAHGGYKVRKEDVERNTVIMVCRVGEIAEAIVLLLLLFSFYLTCYLI
jgi:hypothetical protein